VVLSETALDAHRRSAQTLAPAIVEMLSSVKVDPSQVRLVATTFGPGSFTGLRVGVTSAKTFAYAVGAEVLGVSTLAAGQASFATRFLGFGTHALRARYRGDATHGPSDSAAVTQTVTALAADRTRLAICCKATKTFRV
jgi:tRNA threonylcarbamoyl adenosine modification protein YeaZ